jgi:flagellar protein FlaG
MDVTNAIGLITPSVGTQTGKVIAPQAEVKSQPVAGAAVTALPANAARATGTRLSVDVDKPTGRFIGRIVDSDTGAVVAQVPSEEMLRLWERTREMLGELLDKTA